MPGRFVFLSLTILCGSLCGPAVLAQSQNVNGSMTLGGVNRTYLVHIPDGLPAKPSLVIAAHGMTENIQRIRSASGWDIVADTGKFIVVYPQSNGQSWDLAPAGNDIKYFLALIDTMVQRYQVDRNRVYEYGFSMGGMMSYALACAVADRFAALAPNSGFPMQGLAPTCVPNRAIPMYHFHGAADDFVPYTRAITTAAEMRAKFKCPATAQVSNPYLGNSKLKKETWGPCEGGGEMAFMHLAGTGHSYYDIRNFHVANEAWNFFKRFSLPASTAAEPQAPHSAKNLQVTVRYAAGAVLLQGNRALSGAKIFDLRGGLIRQWRPEGGPAAAAAIPVNLASGGVYLLKIQGGAGQAPEAIAYLPVP